MAIDRVSIGGVEHGGDGRPPLWADIGTMFGQDEILALEMVRTISRVSRETGWPVVLKGEILDRASICLPIRDYEEVWYDWEGVRHAECYQGLIERKVVPRDAYARIIAEARSLVLPVVMSVYDRSAADWAVREARVDALKVASANITHGPLLRCCASLGVPVAVDTGRATRDEIRRALKIVSDGGAPVLIGHAPPGNPCPPALCHLGRITVMRQTFGHLVGLSDHSATETAALLAVALGADYIERNVAPNLVPDQEVSHATVIGGLAHLIGGLCETWEMVGGREPPEDSGYSGQQAETSCASSRMGLVAARHLDAGTVVAEENLDYAFPDQDHHREGGHPVGRMDEILGRRIRASIEAGCPIQAEDVE